MNRFYLILLVIILGSRTSIAAGTTDEFSQESVLRSGQWFKIAVTTEGVYRIDYSKLKQAGLTNPSNPRIYGNNAGQLSYFNDDPKPDDLKEMPVYISGSDNTLNDGEYLLFYAKGTGKWVYNYTSGDYNWVKHNYCDTAFYFLTSSSVPGKRITAALEPTEPENYSSTASDALYIHELESVNLIKSGREWYQQITASKEIDINPSFSDILTNEKMKISYKLAAHSSIPSMFRIYEGETLRKGTQLPAVNIYDYTGTYASVYQDTSSSNPLSASPEYSIRFYNNGEAGALGWIDWVRFQGRRSTVLTGSPLLFSDSRSVAVGRITRFSVKTSLQNVLIWDITDQFNLKQVGYSRNGDNISFKTTTDSLRTFFAFQPSSALTPSIIQRALPNQDLHSSEAADMIIVTHPLFMKQAELLAGIHSKNNGLVSLIVTPGQIYNEFSGGIPDIVAIRNFLRMKYKRQKNTSHPLKYLLLFGDGSFENKTLPPDNPNFIPTYQSQNSTVYVSSFTSDDFYTLLNDGDGEADGTECIGVGRLPVADTSQAGILVRKIARYINPSNLGDWKNEVCLTADDEDGNTHMTDAEGLATVLRNNAPFINTDKIYLDAFKQVSTVNGQSYPDVNKAINTRINDGCLIFNYSGHGSESGLAAERVVKPEDINSWKNGSKMPLFITATCEFSRFDDLDGSMILRKLTGRSSAGEFVLLNENGGGIALMSTTRLVYSAPNYQLNKNILAAAFMRDTEGNSLCFGDIIRIAKNNSGTGYNKRNFTLLGDPAVKLAYPWHGKVVTDSINHSPVTMPSDTMRALSRVTVSGHVEDNTGRQLSSFNGIVSPRVYDKAARVKTLSNDGGQAMEFDLRNSILFNGKTMARNGEFRFSFIVPRDIDYTFGKGNISYYAYADSSDMNGNYSSFIVGGFSNIAIIDTTGPEIRLFINDTLFRDGGIAGMNPRLLAIIEDSGGINTTGAGIGHDITSYLDDDKSNSVVLNSYFENDFNNNIRGSLTYNLNDITRGNHTITLKAWDYYNNSSVEELHFIFESDGSFLLNNLMNFPNPVTSGTSFTAGHTRAGSDMDVTIAIYSLDGRIVRNIRTSLYSDGYVIPPVWWDGNDTGGSRVGRGIYPYRITVVLSDGATANASGKLIIL